MNAERHGVTFPIHSQAVDWLRFPDCPTTIPWDELVPYTARLERNHGGQTLARLAERGGLDLNELYWAIHDLPWGAACPNIYELIAVVKRLNGLEAPPQHPGQADAGPSPRLHPAIEGPWPPTPLDPKKGTA